MEHRLDMLTQSSLSSGSNALSQSEVRRSATSLGREIGLHEIRDQIWFGQVRSILSRIENKCANWDGHDAVPVSRTTIAYVLNMLDGIKIKDLPRPELQALSDGGIMIEWHVGGIELEIFVTKPLDAYFDFTDDRAQVPAQEGEISQDFSPLFPLVKAVSQRTQEEIA